MNLQSADRKLTPITEALPELLSSLPRMVETEEVPLRVAVGRILGTEVLAGIDVPPFANSAMDGYAVRAAEFINERVFPVSQRIAAGEVGGALNTGSVARIFTGAPLPPGADAVVMQENIESLSEGSEFCSLFIRARMCALPAKISKQASCYSSKARDCTRKILACWLLLACLKSLCEGDSGLRFSLREMNWRCLAHRCGPVKSIILITLHSMLC